MSCFRWNTTENFIFLLKYRQQKVDLNTSKKSLVFVRIRQRKFHLYVQVSFTKISYVPRNMHLRKDAAFLHFRLRESSDNIISQWNGNLRKLTKLWYFLSFLQIFERRKLFFLCSDYNSEFREIESKIPSISGSATNSELIVVENKIPDTCILIKNPNKLWCKNIRNWQESYWSLPW